MYKGVFLATIVIIGSCAESTTPIETLRGRLVEATNNDKPIKFACVINNLRLQEQFSASIVSQHFVVTSCSKCLQKSGLKVQLHDLEVLVPEFSETYSDGMSFHILNVRTTVVHPHCRTNRKFNTQFNIGLVQTVEGISFGKDVGRALIPHVMNYRPETNEDVRITTLPSGRTDASSPKDALWSIKVRLAPPASCCWVPNDSSCNPEQILCTPYEHAKAYGNCEEDLGASLSIGKVLIGVMVNKTFCGKAEGSVASFVNVALASPWLMEVVRGLSNKTEDIYQCDENNN